MTNVELKEIVVSTLNNWLEKHWDYFQKEFGVENGEELVDLYGFGYLNQDNKIIYMCNNKNEIIKAHLNAREIWERIGRTREEPHKERNILYCLLHH